MSRFGVQTAIYASHCMQLGAVFLDWGLDCDGFVAVFSKQFNFSVILWCVLFCWRGEGCGWVLFLLLVWVFFFITSLWGIWGNL